MTVDKVRERIAHELCTKLEDVKDEARLVEDLGADELDLVYIVMRLEEEFGIHIPDDAVETFLTVRDVVNYMEENTRQ